MRVKYTQEQLEIFKKISKNIKFYFVNNNCSAEDTDEFGRITIERLAELAGTSASQLANVLAPNVKQTFSLPFVFSISKALGIPYYAFFLDKPIKNPPKEPLLNEEK